MEGGRKNEGEVDEEEDVVEMKRSREVVASRASFDKFAAVALAELAVWSLQGPCLVPSVCGRSDCC